MSKLTTSQKILLSILILSLGYLIYDTFATGGDASVETTTRAVIPGTPAADTPQDSSVGATITQPGRREFMPPLESRRWGRDPFNHPVQLDTTSDRNVIQGQATDMDSLLRAQYKLTAISRREGDAYVLINNEVLTEDDTLGEAKLVEIRSNSVVMRSGGRTFIVYLDNT